MDKTWTKNDNRQITVIYLFCVLQPFPSYPAKRGPIRVDKPSFLQLLLALRLLHGDGDGCADHGVVAQRHNTEPQSCGNHCYYHTAACSTQNRTSPATVVVTGLFQSTPDRIRTCDLQSRSLIFCTARKIVDTSFMLR